MHKTLPEKKFPLQKYYLYNKEKIFPVTFYTLINIIIDCFLKEFYLFFIIIIIKNKSKIK